MKEVKCQRGHSHASQATETDACILLKATGVPNTGIKQRRSEQQYLSNHGRDPRPPQPDVRRAVDGVQGAAAPLPHHLPLDPGD